MPTADAKRKAAHTCTGEIQMLLVPASSIATKGYKDSSLSIFATVAMLPNIDLQVSGHDVAKSDGRFDLLTPSVSTSLLMLSSTSILEL